VTVQYPNVAREDTEAIDATAVSFGRLLLFFQELRYNPHVQRPCNEHGNCPYRISFPVEFFSTESGLTPSRI